MGTESSTNKFRYSNLVDGSNGLTQIFSNKKNGSLLLVASTKDNSISKRPFDQDFIVIIMDNRIKEEQHYKNFKKYSVVVP